MTFLANRKDLFLFDFLQFSKHKAQGFLKYCLLQTFHRLQFFKWLPIVYLFISLPPASQQYCANREDVLIFLFYDPEFLHALDRDSIYHFFPLHKERKNCQNSQIKSVDIRERERKREKILHAWTTFTTLCCYQLNCCHIIKNDTAPPPFFLHCALLQKNHSSQWCVAKRQITIWHIV